MSLCVGSGQPGLFLGWRGENVCVECNRLIEFKPNQKRRPDGRRVLKRHYPTRAEEPAGRGPGRFPKAWRTA